MNVLIQPHVSEKSANAADKAGQNVFRVAGDATRGEVKVEGVNVLNRPAKTRRFRNIAGKRSGFKKAYVRLASGQTIDFTGTAK